MEDESNESESLEIESDLDIDFEYDSSVCDLLLESDRFSETASEFYQELTGPGDVSRCASETSQEVTESEKETTEATEATAEQASAKKKRKRKSHLAYQRKFEKKKIQGASVDEEDVCVDILSVDEEGDSTDKALLDNEPAEQANDQSILGCIKADLQTDQESTTEPNPIAKKLAENLKLLLHTSWTVDIVQNIYVRLVRLSDSKNAAVDLCIYWDCEKASLGIFVHGLPVPTDNSIFLSRAIPVLENIGSVSDYLCSLANTALKLEMCSGIKEHTELWNAFQGYIDHSSSDASCYRSAECSILISDKKVICQNCINDLEKLKREAQREERRLKMKAKKTGGKKFHKPDTQCSRDELKEKKDKWKQKCRKAERRADRLQKKAEDLQIKLDEMLRNDLLGVLIANEHKMTPIQKAFWESQKAALLVKDKRGLRWHPMIIRVAPRLHSFSSGAFEFLRDSKIMVLPSQRTLFDYRHFMEAKEGCQKEVIVGLREKIMKKGNEDHHWFINLMFDEMHIRSGLVTRRSTGELIGYTNLTDIDEDLQKLQKELESKTYKPKLAKKVLVYFAQGLTSEVQDVVAIYSTDDLYASQLFDRTWEVVYQLEGAGVKVLCLTCDGAAVNRKFFRMHSCMDSASQEIYCTKNLASGDSRNIYFIIDPVHLLKTIRNALANSFSHRKTRKLWKNGQFLSWKVLELVYEVTKNDEHRIHKLTKAHIALSSFSCMTVIYAVQALSNSVAEAIQILANDEAFEMLDTEELVKFIKLLNRFFDCLNGKQEEGETVKKADCAAYKELDDERLTFLTTEFLDYFEDWKRDVEERPGIFSATEKAQMIISYQALEALQITVKSIDCVIRYMLKDAKAPFINSRLLNQDPLEQYFGKVRRKQGDNRNPTLKAVLDTSLDLRAQGLVALPSKRGNTSVEVPQQEGLTVDDSPLPKRPRQK